jgi:hypothetical protein
MQYMSSAPLNVVGKCFTVVQVEYKLTSLTASRYNAVKKTDKWLKISNFQTTRILSPTDFVRQKYLVKMKVTI